MWQKFLETLTDKLEYKVSFFRLKVKSTQQFCMPNVPDISFVQEQDLKFILPEPLVSGSIKMQSYYKFPVNLSLLNIC